MGRRGDEPHHVFERWERIRTWGRDDASNSIGDCRTCRDKCRDEWQSHPPLSQGAAAGRRHRGRDRVVDDQTRIANVAKPDTRILLQAPCDQLANRRRCVAGLLLHTGDDLRWMADGVLAVPWWRLM